MLTYHNFKLPSAYKSAEIMDGSPFLRFKVDVKVSSDFKQMDEYHLCITIMDVG